MPKSKALSVNKTKGLLSLQQKRAENTSVPLLLAANIISIIRLLVEGDMALGVKELSEKLALTVSATHRILKSLCSESIVMFDDETKLYRIGPEFLRLSAIAVHSSHFVRMAEEVMRELVMKTDETVCLNLYDPAEAMFSVLHIEESSRALQYVLEPGALAPLHSGAGGCAILAFLPAETIKSALSRHRPNGYAKLSPTNNKMILGQLKKIRNSGYAVMSSENMEGAVGIAVPVMDSSDKVVGSMQLMIPCFRFEQDRVEHLAGQLNAQAKKLKGLVRRTS